MQLGIEGEHMKKFIAGFFIALSLIAGTVAVSHYLADSSKVAAEPGGE